MHCINEWCNLHEDLCFCSYPRYADEHYYIQMNEKIALLEEKVKFLQAELDKCNKKFSYNTYKYKGGIE